MSLTRMDVLNAVLDAADSMNWTIASVQPYALTGDGAALAPAAPRTFPKHVTREDILETARRHLVVQSTARANPQVAVTFTLDMYGFLETTTLVFRLTPDASFGDDPWTSLVAAPAPYGTAIKAVAQSRTSRRTEN
jgi:hypothetical protein